MKIDITRGEAKGGLIFKKVYPSVTVQVQFTEEEKKVIEVAKLGNHILCERPKRAGEKASEKLDDIWHLRVRQLLSGKPDQYEFENLAEANSYNDALVPSLKNLKAAIELNSRPIENTSIEL
jgi:hypothetical protein